MSESGSVLEVNKEILTAAMLWYCQSMSTNKIVMTDFAEWCKTYYPAAGEELEKFAANVFNGLLWGTHVTETE